MIYQHKYLLSEVLKSSGIISGNTELDVSVISNSANKPEVSFVVPVYNQEKLIIENLNSILENSELLHELVVVLDKSTDASKEVVEKWAKNHIFGAYTSRVVLVAASSPLYETVADCIGIHYSTAEYIVEIQSDMTIQDFGFDKRLVSGLQQNNDLFALSGRGIHPASWVLQPKLMSRPLRLLDSIQLKFATRNLKYKVSNWVWAIFGTAGRVGRLMDFEISIDKISRIYVGGFVMRGPLAFSKSKYEELGGFDTDHFFLGNDDHDIVLRAHILQGWKSAFLPINYSSPLEFGSTRSVKSENEESKFKIIQNFYFSKESNSFLWKNKNKLNHYPRRELKPRILN